MRITFLNCAVVLLMCGFALGAKQTAVFDHTVVITATKLVHMSDAHLSGSQTTTKCDGLGDSIDCTSNSTPRVYGGESILVQTIEVNGVRYRAKCHDGFGRSIAAGASQGAGNSVVSGCQLIPGEYRSREDSKGRLHLQLHRGTKIIDQVMDILESEKISP